MQPYNIGAETPPEMRDEVQSLRDLEDWMIDRIHAYADRAETQGTVFESNRCEVRRYIAASIKFSTDDEGSGLYQTGCSPNYYGGVWSLACCKHHMRSSPRKFRNAIFGWDASDTDSLTPMKPLFVFTYAQKSHGHQFLASIAMVTHGFKTMTAYRNYLENQGISETAATARLTAAKNPTPEASRFGDCHAGQNVPESYHPHMKESSKCSSSRASKTGAYKADMRGDHVICVSEPGYWTAWTHPVFRTRVIKGQNAHGRPLRQQSDESLDHVLLRLLDEDDWLEEVDPEPRPSLPIARKPG